MFFYRDTPEIRSLIFSANGFAATMIALVFLGALVEEHVHPALGAVPLVVALPVGVAWQIACLPLIGGTVVQRLAGVRVVRAEDGGRPGVVAAAIRLTWMIAEGALLLVTGPFGMFALLVARARRQGRWWHDAQAGTRLDWAPNRLAR